MDNPELYNSNNTVTRAGTIQFLDEYAPKIKWGENGARFIDLGCGDGSVTCILKKYAPKHYEVVACDISAKMLKFARERYADEQISFRVFNIEGDLLDDMRCGFDNVFSFYTLHWIQDQEKGYRNIYNMLKPGGECLLSFVTRNPINNLYGIIGRNQNMKWSSSWLKDTKKFVSIYCEMQDPGAYIHDIMRKIGFKNIEVRSKEMTYHFLNVLTLKKFVKSLEPFNMPDDVFDEFFDDFMQEGKACGFFDKGINDIYDLNKKVFFKYHVLNIFAKK